MNYSCTIAILYLRIANIPIKTPDMSNKMLKVFIGSATGLGVLPPLPPCPAAIADEVNKELSNKQDIVNR